MNIRWNGDNYAENFNFVYRYGGELLDLIPSAEGALVCDLGCGTGVLTDKIRQRGYRAVGVDASAEMLKKAAAAYPDLEWIEADALSFALAERADVVFSNAVFHWIERGKQPKLLNNIAANLKRGGTLVCEFGGSGCAKTVHDALKTCFEKRGLTYVHPHYFPTVGEYAPKLEAAGFRVEYARLFDRPTKQNGDHGVADWIDMFLAAPFYGLEERVKREIVAEAEELCRPKLWVDGAWWIDYVRIRFTAVKEGD